METALGLTSAHESPRYEFRFQKPKRLDRRRCVFGRSHRRNSSILPKLIQIPVLCLLFTCIEAQCGFT